MSGRLDGSVIVCTGGGSGIGRATVDAFVHEGARVAVLEVDDVKAAELEGAGESVLSLQGDARSEEDNDRLVSEAQRRWGRIDTLVTFVGIFDGYTPLSDIPPSGVASAFDEIFGTNVLAPLVSVRAALEPLRRSRGSVVLTLSSSSFYAGRGGVLYVASKFALRGMVVQLAHELAPDVRVNGVAPGGTIGTDLRAARSLGGSDQRLDDRPGRRESLEQRTPLHLALEAPDHAGAYVYLSSADARGVTGEILKVDGGLGAR